jgi:2-polyprenyl-3-methyl-5-hydroxy-6-metoxy-1,4-benzoquinol methylase
MSQDLPALQHASWDVNADAWTQAVRTGAIASRRRGTDAAVIAACAVQPGERVLDVGCGEGWLSRALGAAGGDVLGVDGAAALIDAARAAGRARFEVVTYQALSTSPTSAAGPFDLIVCNFALLDEDLVPLLSGLRRRLAPTGRLVIQTVHPVVAAGQEGYREGWREEIFAAFGGDFRAPMPWFYRTFEGWVTALRHAELAIAQLQEPRDADGNVLSLVWICTAPPRHV